MLQFCSVPLHPCRSKHHLKLYAEGNPPLTTKKPVVKESYDEIVFNEPQLSFFHRVRSNPMLQVHGTPAALAAARAMADAGEGQLQARRVGTIVQRNIGCPSERDAQRCSTAHAMVDAGEGQLQARWACKVRCTALSF